jgi:hypothetical protein
MNRLVIRGMLAACLLSTAVHAQSIKLQRPVPYAEDNDISDKIKTECRIGEQLADFIKEYGADVEFTTGPVDVNAPGRVLHLEITDAVSMGNAWLGHQKSTKVKGVLYGDGQRIAAFKARRNSMGGAFAGYKGSCSVLGRTVKALGEDIAGWLKSPVDGATLGD